MLKIFKDCFCPLSAGLLVVALAGAHGVDAAPRAEDHSLFKQLFAKKIEQVQQTRDTDDDVELIGEMRDAAGSIPDSPEVQRLIYHAMIDLATSSKNYLLAVESIDLLHAKFPDDPAVDIDQTIELLEQGYRSSRREDRQSIGQLYLERLMLKTQSMVAEGDYRAASRELRRARLVARDIDSPSFDSIQDAIDRVDRLIRTEANIRELKAALEKEPSNSNVATELTRLLMIVKDDPKQALQYVGQTKNATWIDAVKLAAMDQSELNTDESLRVAQWYNQQSKASSYDDDVLRQVLTTVVDYCDHILATYPHRDAKRLRVASLKDNAAERLAKLSDTGAVVSVEEWTDLIKRFDAKKHGLGGVVKAEGGKISVKEADLILSVSPDAGYDLLIGYTFIEGNAGINFCLPIGNGHFTLAYSRAQHKKTLLYELVEVTNENALLRPGRKGELLISVRRIGDRDVSVKFMIDKDTVIDWQGDGTDLRVNPGYLTPEKFGQSIRMSCGGTFVFNKMQYKEVKAQPKD